MNEDGKMEYSGEEIYTKWQHEREMTRIETQCKRWFIVFLVMLVALIGTNLGWIIYESQFQDVVIEQDGFVDGDGANYLNGMGEMRLNVGEGAPDDTDSGSAGQR